MELTAKVRIEAGTYWAEVEELPGCFASGQTLDELFESLREAIDLVADSKNPAGAGRSLRLTTAVLSDKPPVPA
jgi:predicted RNase H-like HicB family nuclease